MLETRRAISGYSPDRPLLHLLLNTAASPLGRVRSGLRGPLILAQHRMANSVHDA